MSVRSGQVDFKSNTNVNGFRLFNMSGVAFVAKPIANFLVGEFGYNTNNEWGVRDPYSGNWIPIIKDGLLLTGGGGGGATILNDLLDVDLVTESPTKGDRFYFDGVQWIPIKEVVYTQSSPEVMVQTGVPATGKTTWYIDHSRGYKVDVDIFLEDVSGNLEYVLTDWLRPSGEHNTHIKVIFDNTIIDPTKLRVEVR